jgi:hypothetical protein
MESLRKHSSFDFLRRHSDARMRSYSLVGLRSCASRSLQADQNLNVSERLS